MKSRNDSTPPSERKPGVQRRGLLGAIAASFALAAAPSLGAPTADDTVLFSLIRELNEARRAARAARAADAEAFRLYHLLPNQFWTPDEIAAHRIQESAGAARFISLEDIEKNDRCDHPGYSRTSGPEFVDAKSDAGTTRTVTMVTFFPRYTEADLSAWRDRCAARRALYDAKEAAYDEAHDRLGVEAAEERSDALWMASDQIRERIAATKPVTAAGIAMKIRLHLAGDEPFDPDESFDPDGIDSTDSLLVSALADLDRLGGAA